MTRAKRSGGGRKSKGEREVFATRVSIALADRIRDDADALDVSYTDLLANVLAAHYGMPPEAPAAATGHDQMRMTA